MTLNDLKTQVRKNKPHDFDEVWEKWLNETKAIPNSIEVVKTEETEFGCIIDFYFNSINDVKVFTRLYRNELSIENNRPLIVLFHGSGSNSYSDHNIWHSMNWVNQGYSVVMMDARNQGGSTIDINDYEFNDRHYLCNGCLDKETHYDKRLYLDACKLLYVTRDSSLELFKDYANKPVVAAGPSQGGELTLVVSSLTDIPALAVCDIPSGCALIERIENRNGKYTALSEIIDEYPEYKDKIYKACGYFDIINMSHKINCPVLASIGTVDDVCPAEFFYEAYLNIPNPKEIFVYEGYGHGGFEELHLPIKYDFVARNIK